MKNINVLLIWSISTLFLFACSGERVDMIIHNATIYTVDEEFSKAEAMAIRNDTIVEIGPENQILNKYSSDKVINAEQMFVYPGFIDAHSHFYGLGMNTLQVNLVGSRSWSEVMQRVDKFDHKGQPWLLGRGWDQSNWSKETKLHKSTLSKYGNIPISLKRIDGHAILVNQIALDLAGIDKTTNVEGGIIVKDSLGEPSGLLIDNATALVEKLIPDVSEELKIEALKKAQKRCVKNGLTTVTDAGLDLKNIHLIRKMLADGELKIHIYAMANPSQENLDFFLSEGPMEEDKIKVRSFKFYADGALGSRGAKLLLPYNDDTTFSGLSIHQKAYFDSMATIMYQSGFQMNTHAIGDSAVRMMLDVYGGALKSQNDRRWRIEHAQVVNENDLQKFRDFTVIPSVQPTHATSDMDWAEKRLGKERIADAYAYKKLLELNGMLPLGTDFPVEDVSPIKTFYAAVTRKDTTQDDTNAFLPQYALTRREAIQGMTIWAAIACFEENEKGSLVSGKKAHVVILDHDLMKAPEKDLLNTKVLYTIIDGEVVYQNNGNNR